jgi:hypothetical protein
MIWRASEHNNDGDDTLACMLDFRGDVENDAIVTLNVILK